MEKLAIFRPKGLGTQLHEAADAFLKNYVYDENPDNFQAEHDLTDFERAMVTDFLAALFSDENFSNILQAAAHGMKAGGLDPEGPDV